MRRLLELGPPRTVLNERRAQAALEHLDELARFAAAPGDRVRITLRVGGEGGRGVAWPYDWRLGPERAALLVRETARIATWLGEGHHDDRRLRLPRARRPRHAPVHS